MFSKTNADKHFSTDNDWDELVDGVDNDDTGDWVRSGDRGFLLKRLDNISNRITLPSIFVEKKNE